MTENNSPKLAQYGSTLDGIPQEKRQKCEVWTRVMGYHRPVESFNIGKKTFKILLLHSSLQFSLINAKREYVANKFS